ncbi:MAG: hypothetical protein ACR2O0_16305 [Rhizobiaceae bacterium]
MNTNKFFRPAIAATVFAVVAASSVPASAAGFGYFSLYNDGTQAFNSRAVAGAAPNALATYRDGVRCHYEYRNQWGAYGNQRVRIEVCN